MILRKIVPFCLLLSLCNAASSQDTTKLNVAVNNLKGSGIEKATAEILSDRFRSELIRTGVFRIMERAEMENILKEQSFQRSDACYEKSCVMEMGKLLGVDRMIAGSIGKVEKFYTISVRMIKVSTGEILYTVDEDFEGNIKKLISTVIGKVALKIAQAKECQLKPTKVTIESAATKEKVFKKNIQNIRRIVLGGLAAGFFGAGIYYNNEVKKSEDKYYTNKTSNQLEHDKNWEDIEKNQTIRNIMYGLSGASAIGFGISIPF